jgi:uncharacterized iron-regulated protein
MSSLSRFVVALILSLSFAGAAYPHEVIVRTSDGQNVTLPQMLADSQKSDLVLIGESHDNKTHHELQLSLIRSLWEKKVPLAIGLEMFQSDSQQALDDWTEGRMNEPSFKLAFVQNWSLDWDMYRDIFYFARDKKIPMIALNVPSGIVKKVAHHGFSSLSEEEKKNLPSGASCDLNNPHTIFLKKTFEEVSNHITSQKVFTYFCEAQTLRNSGMAMAIDRYVRKHPGRKIVGLTGIWHAIKNAIPEQLERNGSKVACTVILPDVPELSLTDNGTNQADYMVDL